MANGRFRFADSRHADRPVTAPEKSPLAGNLDAQVAAINRKVSSRPREKRTVPDRLALRSIGYDFPKCPATKRIVA